MVADCGFADVDVLLRRQWGAASGGLPDFYRPTTIMIGRLVGYDFYADHPVEEIGRIAPRPRLLPSELLEPREAFLDVRDVENRGDPFRLHSAAYPAEAGLYLRRTNFISWPLTESAT